MTSSLTSVEDGGRALARRDPVMARAQDLYGVCAPRPGEADPFAALCRAIVYQKLAGASAAAIHGRFVGLFDTLRPEQVVVMREERLRSTGLSAAKTAALLDLATRVVDGRLPLADLGGLSDAEIVERLVAVHGIGPWTAEMFLIFELRRPDVWPAGDLGVRRGYGRLYGVPAPTIKEMPALGERFAPHRTAAAWYCWRAAGDPAAVR